MLINYWGYLQRTNQIHYMKKYLLLLLSLLSLQSFAAENQVVQEVAVVESVVEEPAYNPQYRDVPPTFLGIPIDGPRTWFEDQLIEKRGFVKDDEGFLHGRFYGQDVELRVFDDNAKKMVDCVRVIFSEVKSSQALINQHNQLFDDFMQSEKYEYGYGYRLDDYSLSLILKNPANIRDMGVVRTNLDGFRFAEEFKNGIVYRPTGVVEMVILYLSADVFNMRFDEYTIFLNYYNFTNDDFTEDL